MKHLKMYEGVKKPKDTKGETNIVKNYNEFSASTNKHKAKKKVDKESEEHEEHVKKQEIVKSSGGNA